MIDLGSHKRRADRLGNPEGIQGPPAPQTDQCQSIRDDYFEPWRKPYRLVCERFIYLITDPSGLVVKVGVSDRPERRLAELARRHCKSLVFVQSWSVGIGTRHDATCVEKRLHKHLQDIALYHSGEWYLLAASRASAAIDAFSIPADLDACLTVEQAPRHLRRVS